MGRKGARTRSGESVRTRQTSGRLADASRKNRQDFRVGRSKNKRKPKSVAIQGARARQKLLASTRPLSQTAKLMDSSGRSQTCPHVLAAAVLFAAFSWTLLVSVSPQLHECIHGDANRNEHICAITLIASGTYEHAAHPPVISAPQFDVCFPATASLTTTWVKPLFLNAHIFAHAPPTQS